jgi:hypothetical protein
MNKPELIAAINKLPDDIEFLSPKDDEGNGYRWLTGVSLEYIRKDEAEGWEIDSVLSEDDVEEDYTPEEVELLLKKVAIIW